MDVQAIVGTDRCNYPRIFGEKVIIFILICRRRRKRPMVLSDTVEGRLEMRKGVDGHLIQSNTILVRRGELTLSTALPFDGETSLQHY
jgi:hypothetical protein